MFDFYFTAEQEHHYDVPERVDKIDVVQIYETKNKTLEEDLCVLQSELKKAKEMLANVEKYWSQQVRETA